MTSLSRRHRSFLPLEEAVIAVMASIPELLMGQPVRDRRARGCVGEPSAANSGVFGNSS